MLHSLPRLTLVLVVLACASIAFTSGCSFSYSSKSISESSSPSNDSDSEAQAYRSDLSNFTVVAMRSGQSEEAYLAGLSRIAEEHGVTAWEQDQSTYRSIGAGLRQAGVERDDLPRLPLVRVLTERQPETLDAIIGGYQS